MSEIQQLQPKLLWNWFDKICAIPHPSYHEEKLAQFILDWAKGKGFFVQRDSVGNILIRKPATKGMENRKSVILQAHLDMVPQANEGIKHDFLTDPILPYIDSDWVKANGTTLGADNGIGMASALAILESCDLSHPDLEVLLTMTEEQGMEGAIGLQPNWLQGSIMINTDTEEDGEIYIGCAGGENADINIPLVFKQNDFANHSQLVLKGLSGGHSGCDIHTGRVNAIKMLARFLAYFKQNNPTFDFAIASIEGGTVRNAIPREAFATLCFNGEFSLLESAVQNFAEILRNELSLSEPNLALFLQSIDKPTQVFDSKTNHKIIDLINLLPNGVIRNSDVVDGVVETSLSIGVLKIEENKLRGTILIRSLIESGREYVENLLLSLASLSDAKVSFSGAYPG